MINFLPFALKIFKYSKNNDIEINKGVAEIMKDIPLPW